MGRLLASSLLLSLVASGTSLAGGVDAPASSSDAEQRVSVAQPATASPVATPHWQALATAEANGYRVSLSRGAVDLGVRFESRPVALRPSDGRYDAALPMGATLPSLSFGLRNVAAPAPANTLVERALGAQEESESSKVGVEWKPAQSRVFFHQGVGVRLAGDDRLVMRMKKGSLGLFMHAAF